MKIKLIGITGALAVILGAFGAHKLKEMLPPSSIETYQTAVLYHFIHVLAMAISHKNEANSLGKSPSLYFFLGILFFSGSLYLLSCREILGEWVLSLGPITPIGGLFFITGWSVYAFQNLKN